MTIINCLKANAHQIKKRIRKPMMKKKRTEIIIPKDRAILWLDKNGRWHNVLDDLASGGAYIRSDTPGDSIAFAFEGAGVDRDVGVAGAHHGERRGGGGDAIRAGGPVARRDREPREDAEPEPALRERAVTRAPRRPRRRQARSPARARTSSMSRDPSDCWGCSAFRTRCART